MNLSVRVKSLLLALLSALILWAAWPPHKAGVLVFFGFVPLLFIQDYHQQGLIRTRFFRFIIYLSILIWNILTTWWIWNASPGGSVAAIVLNTLMMSMVWWAFDALRRSRKTPRHEILDYGFLVAFWVAYEFFHLNWESPWPWLVLGNVFANNTSMIQWYEYTGHLGGSIWVLVMNVLVFHQLRNRFANQPSARQSIISMAVMLFPILLSFIILFQRRDFTVPEVQQKPNVLIVQPNLDPYTEKFNDDGLALSPDRQLFRMLDLASKKINENTRLIVFPETALQGGLRTDLLDQEERLIQIIRSFLRDHPACAVITGATTYTMYPDKATPTARQLEPGGKYFDFYNSAILIDTSSYVQLYHKSRLVPGVEKLPYPWLFGPLVTLLNLDAQSGGLGIQQEPAIFVHGDLQLAPLVCYESVFGGYVQEFVQRGANSMVVITNDGWWGNTDGYKQHLDYAKLRCIELRRELVQCANTGLSAYINPMGEIKAQTEWWKQDVLEATLTPETEQTFYGRFGDYWGWICVGVSMALLLRVLGYRFFKKN